MSTSTPTTQPAARGRRRIVMLVALCFLIGAGLWLFQPARRATIHLERGKLYLRQDRAEAALAEFNRTRALAPPAWEAQYLSGQALAKAGRGAEAVKTWQALQSTPWANRALAAAAEQARQDGDVEQALAICTEAQQAGLSPVPFLAVEARIRAAEGDVDAAATGFRRALAIDPKRTDIATELANLLRGAGRLDQAEAALADTLKAMPGNVPILLQLGELAKLQGRPQEAISRYWSVLESQPDLTVARVAIMELYQQVGDADAATAEANRIINDPSAAPLAHFVLGQTAYRAGDNTGAVEHLEAAHTGLRDDPAVLLWLGKAQLKAGDPDAALQTLRAAIPFAEQSLELRLDLARALWDASDFEQARDLLAIVRPEELQVEADRDFLATVRTETPAVTSGTSMADLLEEVKTALQDKDYEKAHRLAVVAQRREPDDPRPLVYLGLAAAGRQDIRSALGYLEEARRRDPGNVLAALNRARLLRGLGHPELAIPILTHAMEADPASVGALLPEAAVLLVGQGRAAEAETLIQQQGGTPLASELAALLAQALLLQDRAKAAEGAVAEVDGPHARLARARALLAEGKDGEAQEQFLTLRAEGLPPAVDTVAASLLANAAGDPAWKARDGQENPFTAACELARGNLDDRFRVAQDFGTVGAVLGMVAIMETGNAEVAEKWRAAQFGGAGPMLRDQLPSDVRAFKKALLSQMLGWPDVAIRYYRDAGEAGHPILLEPYAISLTALGKKADALALMEQATSYGPPLEPVWVRRVILDRDVRGESAALNAVEQALAVLPGSATLLTLAGELHETEGKRDEAVDFYRRALAAGPSANAQAGLARVLAEDPTRIAEAIELGQAANQARPFTPSLLATLATCYLRHEQPEQGLFYANLALLLDPFDAQRRLQRAQALVAAGHAEAIGEDCQVLGEAAPEALLNSREFRELCQEGAAAAK